MSKPVKIYFSPTQYDKKDVAFKKGCNMCVCVCVCIYIYIYIYIFYPIIVQPQDVDCHKWFWNLLSNIPHQGENRHINFEVYARGFNTLHEKYCIEICWRYGICCLSNHTLGLIEPLMYLLNMTYEQMNIKIETKVLNFLKTLKYL